jgi:exodeoxyribonuclease VII small subunit
MTAKDAKKANFAEAFKELEEIVQWFESTEVDLEEGLKKFERGLELAKKCRSRLADVENKVARIKEKFSDPEADLAVEEDDDQARLL